MNRSKTYPWISPLFAGFLVLAGCGTSTVEEETAGETAPAEKDESSGALVVEEQMAEEIRVTGSDPVAPPPPPVAVLPVHEKRVQGGVAGTVRDSRGRQFVANMAMIGEREQREEYSAITATEPIDASEEPVSTFSIDVDRASYSIVRRFIRDGHWPPPEAVRIEELVNYFPYGDPAPSGAEPFAVTTEVSQSPWNRSNRLLRIGVRGRDLPDWERRPNNLVFLIDVSGSMSSPDKLPLLKSSFRMLVEQLDARDTVSIVTYAGAAGLALPPTRGDHKVAILEAIDRLESGGSTAGGAGIRLAYETIRANYARSGNNRVILATDGDFNVGVSSVDELEKLIESQRDGGVFLSVLGFGTGNLKDNRMEILADRGDGNYSYIDSELEAKKTLVEEMGGTLHAIARDVKIQVEFDPATVDRYQLTGYENRMLENRDFADDTKDAGELGSGHVVTALYEIVPARTGGGHIADVRLRYKPIGQDASLLVTTTARDDGSQFEAASPDLQFSAAIAWYGKVLRRGEKDPLDLQNIHTIAMRSRGIDLAGYRSDFVQMLQSTVKMAGGEVGNPMPVTSAWKE